MSTVLPWTTLSYDKENIHRIVQQNEENGKGEHVYKKNT